MSKQPECPCGFKPPIREGFSLGIAKKYVNHSSEKGYLCRQCGNYAYYYKPIPRRQLLRKFQSELDEKRGRPRMGKTHQPSIEGKRRQNERRKARRKTSGIRFYVYQHKYLTDIMDVGLVPKGNYIRHQRRHEKAGKAFNLNQRFGAKLHICSRQMPAIVQMALLKIYSNRVVTVKKKVKPFRPRARTRSEAIEKLQKELDSIEIVGWKPQNLQRFDRINEMLEEELLMREKRDWEEDPEHRYYGDPFPGSSRYEPKEGKNPWSYRTGT